MMGSGGKGSGGKAPKGWQGGGVGGDGARRSLKHTGARPVDGAGQGKGGTLRSASAATEQPKSHTDGHGQTRTDTDCWRGLKSGRAPKGWAGGPETWNLKPEWTATRTDTDGHGLTRTVGEGRGRRSGGPESVCARRAQLQSGIVF
jgi:hypothetical protein